jgi:hypothetical protein
MSSSRVTVNKKISEQPDKASKEENCQCNKDRKKATETVQTSTKEHASPKRFAVKHLEVTKSYSEVVYTLMVQQNRLIRCLTRGMIYAGADNLSG